MKRLVFLAAVFVLAWIAWSPLPGVAQAAPEPGARAAPEAEPTLRPTYVFLVRHAEKRAPEQSEEASNPELTEAGHGRAAALAHELGETGLETIFSTPFHRTRQTAAPIAAAVGLDVTTTPVGDDYAEALARRIRSAHVGQRVLVVGHSNTTPDVIRALGVAEDEVPVIGDDEYDDLFLVTLPRDGGAWLTRLRYGAESP